MSIRRTILLTFLLVGLPLPFPPPAYADASLKLYGTFHAMGIIITLDAAADPDGDATATVEYNTDGGVYRTGFPLTRVSDTRFVGSLFWLEPGVSYNVRVTFKDPDGGPLDCTMLTGTASTRAEVVTPAPDNSYIVSPSGSGTACSLAAPCSLSQGLNQAQAGDAVILRSGVYYEGEINLLHSGAVGAPIVIKSYSGETAVLDGGDPASFTWTAQGGGVYQTTTNAEDTHLVVANGERLYPYQSLSDLQTLSWGIPGFYADGVTIYVRLTGDADPNCVEMVVSRYNYAFAVERDFIHFLNLTFRHYGQGYWGKAIYFNNASDNLVQGCTFAINDLGIGLKRDSQRNVIQDNTFYDTNFLWSWDAIKAGSRLETGGVRFLSPTTGQGNIIRRNTFHDYFDGFGACPAATGGKTNETDIYENRVYNTGDDGVEADGVCSNVRIWGNSLHDVTGGISLAPVYDGPVYAIRNLIYRIGVGDSEYSGYPFKFNSSYNKSGAMYLFHNTVNAVLPGNNGVFIKAPGTWEMIYARNNIWAGTDYALYNYNETQPLDFDYDNLHTTNPNEFAYWGNGLDRHMRNLATFQSLTGQEPHGYNIEPDFVNIADDDYTLPANSEMIDKGLVIPGINDDYAGAAPDLGAFEYTKAGFTFAAAPNYAAIGPGGMTTVTLTLKAVGGFSQTVALSAVSLPPDLRVDMSPESLAPSGQAILTLTDTHTAPTPPSGVWYTISVTATSGELAQFTRVNLLAGGARLYLPLIAKR